MDVRINGWSRGHLPRGLRGVSGGNNGRVTRGTKCDISSVSTEGLKFIACSYKMYFEGLDFLKYCWHIQ